MSENSGRPSEIKPPYVRQPGDALVAQKVTTAEGVKENLAQAYVNALEYDPVGVRLAMGMWRSKTKPGIPLRATSAILALEQESYMALQCGVCGSYGVERDLDAPVECTDCGHRWHQTPIESVPDDEGDWREWKERGRRHASARTRPWDK